MQKTGSTIKEDIMQYLDTLPQVSSVSVDGDIIELELEEQLDKLDSLPAATQILVANYAGQITVVVGEVLEHENIHGPDLWCRIKMKGSIVEFNIK